MCRRGAMRRPWQLTSPNGGRDRPLPRRAGRKRSPRGHPRADLDCPHPTVAFNGRSAAGLAVSSSMTRCHRQGRTRQPRRQDGAELLLYLTRRCADLTLRAESGHMARWDSGGFVPPLRWLATALALPPSPKRHRALCAPVRNHSACQDVDPLRDLLCYADEAVDQPVRTRARPPTIRLEGLTARTFQRDYDALSLSDGQIHPGKSTWPADFRLRHADDTQTTAQAWRKRCQAAPVQG